MLTKSANFLLFITSAHYWICFFIISLQVLFVFSRDKRQTCLLTLHFLKAKVTKKLWLNSCQKKIISLSPIRVIIPISKLQYFEGFAILYHIYLQISFSSASHKPFQVYPVGEGVVNVSLLPVYPKLVTKPWLCQRIEIWFLFFFHLVHFKIKFRRSQIKLRKYIIKIILQIIRLISVCRWSFEDK